MCLLRLLRMIVKKADTRRLLKLDGPRTAGCIILQSLKPSNQGLSGTIPGVRMNRKKGPSIGAEVILQR